MSAERPFGPMYYLVIAVIVAAMVLIPTLIIAILVT